MKRAWLMMVALAGCGSETLPPGEARATGILNDASLERYKHAVFDVFSHDDVRRTYYVVVSPEADICGKLQRKERLQEGVLVMGQNRETSGSYSETSYAALRQQLLSGKPNYGGGLLHVMQAETGAVRVDMTGGTLNSEQVTPNLLRGEASIWSPDDGHVEFAAKRCSQAAATIHDLVARAEHPFIKT